jgi:hypothetical protein
MALVICDLDFGSLRSAWSFSDDLSDVAQVKLSVPEKADLLNVNLVCL